MITKNTIYQNNDQLLDFVTSNFFGKKGNFLAQIFTGDSDVSKIEEICFILKQNINNVHIIGTTTSGEIMNGKNYQGQIVISISLFEKSNIKSFLLEYSEGDENALGKAFCDTYISDEDKLLILFTDGLNTVGVNFLRYLHTRFPNLIVSGAKAGDNKKFDSTFIFDGDTYVENGICGALISGESLEVNNEYSFGWSRVGKLLTVTKSDKNRLYEIDGIIAYDFYKQSLGEEIVKNLPHIGGQFPLILKRNGVFIAREIIKRHSDGSFSLSGDVEENEKVQIGCGQINTILNTDKKIITKSLNGKSIESIFVYSCSGRKSFMGKYLDKEIGIFNCFGESSGFYGYGVFFHTNTYNFVLSETMTILTLSEDPI
ncbi:MAG: FIST N-terminal domain-containing protein, partial [Candidatus Absconditabacteria bacterium]